MKNVKHKDLFFQVTNLQGKDLRDAESWQQALDVAVDRSLQMGKRYMISVYATSKAGWRYWRDNFADLRWTWGNVGVYPDDDPISVVEIDAVISDR